MREEKCEEPDRPTSEPRDPLRLEVRLNGNELIAKGEPVAILPLYRAWLCAQPSTLTQDDLDALVAGQERTARRLETIRDALGAIAKPWKKKRT